MKYNVFIIGDSLTHATGDSKNEIIGWAERFKRLYMKENDDNNRFYVNYLGFSGWTTQNLVDDAIQSFCNIIKNKAFDNSNRIMIIEIGTNDTQSNSEEKTKVSLEKFESNIKTIINEAKKCTNNVLLLGLTRAETEDNIPLFGKENEYYDNRLLKKYDEKLEEICKEKEVNYLPIAKIVKENDYKDGLHPSNSGHEALSRVVYEKVYELFINK